MQLQQRSGRQLQLLHAQQHAVWNGGDSDCEAGCQRSATTAVPVQLDGRKTAPGLYCRWQQRSSCMRSSSSCDGETCEPNRRRRLGNRLRWRYDRKQNDCQCSDSRFDWKDPQQQLGHRLGRRPSRRVLSLAVVRPSGPTPRASCSRDSELGWLSKRPWLLTAQRHANNQTH